MNHWSKVSDSLHVKGRGVLITVDYTPYQFQVQPNWPITLFSPEGVAFTTTVKGVERYARAFELPGDPCGILLTGFAEDADLKDWLFVVHQPRA